jgi:hypothetical protein
LRMLTASWFSLARKKEASASSGSMGTFNAPNDISSVFYTLVYQLNSSNLISVEVLEKPNRDLSESPQLSKLTIPKIVECYATLIPISRTRMPLPQDASQHPAVYSTAVFGQNCLCILEQQLKPSNLSTYSRRRLQALFLLSFGVILLVATAEPAVYLPSFPEVGCLFVPHDALLTVKQEGPVRSRKPKTLFDVLQTHLSNMLAHYLTFIGSKLGLLESVDPDKPLKLKDLNESLMLWEKVLLRWILHWQTRDFDRQWLSDWVSVQLSKSNTI